VPNNFSELLKQALAGSASAFAELIRPHLPMLLAYSRAICGNYHTAEDVVQETALIAQRRLNNFFPETDFASWLKGIARLKALEARRKLTQARLSPCIDEAIESAYVDPSPDGVSPEHAALTECLQRLEGKSAQVIRAHYFGGLNVAEIAATLDLALGTVRSILHRARQALRDCIERRGGEASAS
jgi:RNA polymerase sigma-70 factor (ECF subfamily)